MSSAILFAWWHWPYSHRCGLGVIQFLTHLRINSYLCYVICYQGVSCHLQPPSTHWPRTVDIVNGVYSLTQCGQCGHADNADMWTCGHTDMVCGSSRCADYGDEHAVVTPNLLELLCPRWWSQSQLQGDWVIGWLNHWDTHWTERTIDPLSLAGWLAGWLE